MRRWRWWLGVLAALVAVGACSGDDATSSSGDTGSGASGTGTGTTTGTSTGTATGTGTGSGSTTCTGLSGGECELCFCDEAVDDCNVYLAVLIEHIYCGQSCGDEVCATFCADPMGNALDQPCLDCATMVVDDPNVTTDDVDNFLSDCMNDPACLAFAQIIDACP